MNELIKNLEFISYRPVADDAYGTIGLASFRAYGKFLLVYKHLKTKDGSGTFFCSANYTINEGAEKKYLSAISLDSRGDDQLFQDWVREHVNMAIATKSVRINPIATANIHQPPSQPGIQFQSFQRTPDIKMEASIQEPLPF